MCYKSIGRGANRILIQTDKKIYIETGMMKKCEDVESNKRKGLFTSKNQIGIAIESRFY